jgi:O-antigen ligase
MIYGFGLLTMGLAWLLPGHYFPWTGFQQEFLAAAGLALVALSLLLPGGPRRLSLPPIALFALAVAVVPLWQWLAGRLPFATDGVVPAMYLCAFALAIVTGCALTRQRGTTFIAALMGTMLAAGMASVGIGLVQWLQIGPVAYIEMLEPGARVFGNFTQANHLSTLLALAAAATLWFYETRRIGEVGAAMALAFIGAGMVMAQSRTAWGFVAVLTVWWWLMRRRLSLRTPPAAVVIAVALFVAATFAWPHLNMLVVDQPGASGMTLAERMQVGGRRVHWATLWDAAWRQPWFGYGWLQVGPAQQAAALDHPASREWVTYSHNLVLDLMIWNGIPLALLTCVALAWWAISRCRQCRDVDTWAMLAGGGALLVHAMVEFPLAYSYFLLPLGLMFGVIEARAQPLPTADSPRAAPLPTAVFGVAVVLLTALLGRVGFEYLQIEETEREIHMKEAGYAPGRPDPQLPDVLLLDSQREFLWFRQTEARPGMDGATLDRLRVLNQRFAPPAAMLRYALAAGLNGRDADALRNLRLICNMWTVKNCDEGRDSWRQAQEKYPQLRHIPYPAQTSPR